MKRLFRTVIAVAICMLSLVPAAWGRDNRMRLGHPDNDYRGFVVASHESSTPILFSIPIRLGIVQTLWVVWFPGNHKIWIAKPSSAALNFDRKGASK
jgi:hypothetical protein